MSYIAFNQMIPGAHIWKYADTMAATFPVTNTEQSALLGTL